MTRVLIAVLAFAALLPAAEDHGRALPPKEVPGAVDVSITQANLMNTVCVANYTSTVRPPAIATS